MDCCEKHSFVNKFKGYFKSNKKPETESSNGLRKIILVGSPNVGKSVLFNALTGAYVTVSNYPGTTVEISKGKGKFKDQMIEVIDTPGMYSLLPITEEEKVAREILLTESPDAVVHVVDAKNLRRMLPLTLQLMEADLPLILVVNIMDEAHNLGMKIDTEMLESELGICVVPTAAALGKGIDKLKQTIVDFILNPNIKRKAG